MTGFEIIQDSIIPGQEENKETEIKPEKETTKKKSLFTVVPDDSSKTMLTLPNDYEVAEPVAKRRYTRRKKNENASTELVHKDDDSSVQIEDISTMYSYEETTSMTRETIAQLNLLASEIKSELDIVISSKTIRNRANYIVGLSGNLAQILNTKLTAIREINNNITKANELDYKKQKDMKLLDNSQNDDKYLMDLYNAFISNPAGATNNVLGPSGINATVAGTPIVRASTTNNSDNMIDSGYLNYLSNMSPEQKMMRLEQDPNVQQVVVYDASNGNKFFQVMNIATGEVVTGVPVRDMMFMEDTTIDLKNRIARNTNLNESYPLIVINDDISSEY